MRILKLFLLSLLVCLVVAPAHAILKVGDEAPNFTVDASVGGNQFSFVLNEALKNGPVVLYFYPKAFTSGCTIEAHLFSEAAEEFAKLKATVIGVSSDQFDVVQKFSIEECHSKFAVGADPDGEVIERYDAKLLPLVHRSSRTTYVITPDHKVNYVYKAMSPDDHVKNALDAVKKWQETRPKY